MSRNLLFRLGKISVASAAVILGGWVLANERYGSLVTDAVTNAPLVELNAPADGYVAPLAQEGDLLLPGQEVLLFSELEPQSSERLQEVGSSAIHHGAAPAGTVVTAEGVGRLWDWRSPSGTLHSSGDQVGDIADCTRLIAVSEAATSRTSTVAVGDPVMFTAGDLQWDGVVQRLIAGAPNLSTRYAVHFPDLTPGSYLIIVALDTSSESEPNCAIGLRGKISFQQETAWDRIRERSSSFGTRLAERARLLSRATAGKVLPEGWFSWS